LPILKNTFQTNDFVLNKPCQAFADRLPLEISPDLSSGVVRASFQGLAGFPGRGDIASAWRNWQF
jgi:hypothetical protein